MIFIHVIKQADYTHDKHNKPLYIYKNEDDLGGELLPYESFDWTSLVGKQVYVTDSRYLKYLGVDVSAFQDVSFMYYNKWNVQYEIEEPSLKHFYRRLYPNSKRVNFLLPQSHWLDYCESIYAAYKPVIVGDSNTFYKQQVDVFHTIESKGIMCDGKLEYSRYNFFTATGRPSNAYGGTNFAAFSKKDGSRDLVRSRCENGLLIEVDFESYHPRLIAELVGYEFPKNKSVYHYLAEHYFKTDTPTEEQVRTAKTRTFYKLYSADEDTSIPYFKAITEYVSGMWKSFEDNGYVKAPISGRLLYRENYPQIITKQTLFNYLIQLTETERNTEELAKLSILDKVVLYTYDAILLDVQPNEVESVLMAITQELHSEKYPVRIKVGSTYAKLAVWENTTIFM
jgi:hypothetical protein